MDNEPEYVTITLESENRNCVYYNNGSYYASKSPLIYIECVMKWI